MKMLYKIGLFFALLIFASNVFAQKSEREDGVEFYNKGEYQKAVETLQKVVEADEKDKKSWLYLGMSLAQMKKKSEAVKAFQKADKIPNTDKKPETNQTEINVISKPRPSYTDSARMNQEQGTVKLAVEFGADGKIKEIFPFEKLLYGLTENCVEAVRRIKFEPATNDDKPISAIMIISYNFTIY